MEYVDRRIACLNCGKEFIFSGRDQRYYEQKGFKNAPKRCRECRALLKRERQFVPDGNGGKKELFKVTCADCSRPAYVPFKPTGIKPVYCRDCLVALKIRETISGAAPPPPQLGNMAESPGKDATAAL